MQDQVDNQILDSFEPAKRRRGRPVTGSAMSNADRQRRYRQRLKAKNATVTKNTASEGVDWKGRAVSLQMELGRTRMMLQKMIERNDKSVKLIDNLKASISPLKATATKYRNENQALRDKIRHLESMATVGKS